MKNKNLRLTFWLLLPAVCGGLIACSSSKAAVNSIQVKIAVPQEGGMESAERERYKIWLEQMSGLEIQFTPIPESHTQDYLKMLFTSKNSDIDAVFFTETTYPQPSELELYGDSGILVPLESMLEDREGELSRIISQFEEYDLQHALEGSGGHIYYMPALDTTKKLTHSQIMWMNIEWLEQIDCPLPGDTEEFADTLIRFKQAYPDGVPLLGSSQEDGTFVCHFLMNSFVVCDPENKYMAVKDGKIFYAPMTQEWREGLIYCKRLYDAGILPKQNFSFTRDQLAGMVNDPRDLVGAFAAKSVTDVLAEESSGLFSRYFPLPPLKGPVIQGGAVVETKLPRPGGVILSSSEHKEELFALMDLMCGEEAFLTGHYGLKGQDWNQAGVADISVFGEPAVITIKNQEWHRKSSKTNPVLGPYVTRASYADGVAWVGYQINQGEYLDARAYKTYERYRLEEFITSMVFEDNEKQWEEISGSCYDYTRTWMKDFIVGNRDIHSDTVWDMYCAGLRERQIEPLVEEVQKIYREGGV